VLNTVTGRHERVNRISQIKLIFPIGLSNDQKSEASVSLLNGQMASSMLISRRLS
jgi:hypothetical protein